MSARELADNSRDGADVDSWPIKYQREQETLQKVCLWQIARRKRREMWWRPITSERAGKLATQVADEPTPFVSN